MKLLVSLFGPRTQIGDAYSCQQLSSDSTITTSIILLTLGNHDFLNCEMVFASGSYSMFSCLGSERDSSLTQQRHDKIIIITVARCIPAPVSWLPLCSTCSSSFWLSVITFSTALALLLSMFFFHIKLRPAYNIGVYPG